VLIVGHRPPERRPGAHRSNASTVDRADRRPRAEQHIFLDSPWRSTSSGWSAFNRTVRLVPPERLTDSGRAR